MTITREAPRRPRPGWLARQAFKVPVLLYRLGFGARLERRFLVLTTTGRRTGRPRRAGLDYVETDGRIYVFAGWGEQSDWYRNLLARPEVTVEIGRRRLHGLASPVDDLARRRQLLELHRDQALSVGPPRPVRWLLKRLSIFNFEARVARAVAEAERVPAVEITPVEGR